MGWLRRIMEDEPPPRDNTPRQLNAADVNSLIDASGRRNEQAIASAQRKERSDFMAKMLQRYPLRMRRMHKDLNWLLDQGERHGLSKDELRWLLW